MCTRCTYAFVLPSSEDNLEEMKHELGPIKYDKACLTLLAVPSKNSHVISHCIDYICVLCATILEKGARSAKSLKMTLEVRRAPAASFSQQIHPRVKKTRLEENTTPPPFFTKRNRRRLPWQENSPNLGFSGQQGGFFNFSLKFTPIRSRT